MKLKELIGIIDTLAPFALAEPWDHSGLRLGDPNDDIVSAILCLDATEEAVAEAVRRGANLIITHHPLMFQAQEDMILNRPDVKTVAAAFRGGVNILACHTNFDSAKNGINDTLAAMAGLKDIVPLVPSADVRGFGMGAVGTSGEIDLKTLCRNVAQAWNLSGYRLFAGAPFNGRVALCGGAGGDLWENARDCGATLHITADIRYHETLGATDAGVNLMVCDHGEMENPPLRQFAARIQQASGIPVEYIDLISPKRRTERWCNIPE